MWLPLFFDTVTTSFPSRYATPSQVRAYLIDVLVKKHDSSLADAESIVQSWTYGRGYDLLQASEYTFETFFGNVGSALYQSVTEDIIFDWRSSLLGSLNILMLFCLPVVAIILLFRLYRHTRTASFKTGSLPLERLLWVSGPIVIYCTAQEMAHRSELGDYRLMTAGSFLCLLGLLAMLLRFMEDHPLHR
jgi:hypothetical protein